MHNLDFDNNQAGRDEPKLGTRVRHRPPDPEPETVVVADHEVSMQCILKDSTDS